MKKHRCQSGRREGGPTETRNQGSSELRSSNHGTQVSLLLQNPGSQTQHGKTNRDGRSDPRRTASNGPCLPSVRIDYQCFACFF